MVYWHFLECSTKQPTSIGKWISEFPFLHDNDFSKFYRLPYQTVKDTKIQTFQYTVLNRILPCKEMLFKWNIEETEQCTYCNDCDTLTHIVCMVVARLKHSGNKLKNGLPIASRRIFRYLL